MRYGGDTNGYYGGLSPYSGFSFANSSFTGTSTFTGPSIYSADNLHDIGAIGATRPRTIYAGTNGIFGGNVQAFSGLYVSNPGATFGDAARSLFSSPTNGTMRVTNNAGSGFDAFQYGPSAGATTSNRLQKAVTAFSDGVAKTVLTIAIPNAAHSASVMVRVTGSMGAGGAIGANEASATNAYIVTVVRTAGVNAVATISSAFGAAAANVAGAGTVTATAGLAAVSGAVGAANTIDVQVTITKSGGSSDNHTAVVIGEILNANSTGVSIS